MDVVRLVALADLASDPDSPSTASVSVTQLAELADGRRVVFDDSRGYSFSSSVGATGDALWALETRDEVEATVRMVVGPDEDPDAPDDDDEDTGEVEFEYEFWWAAQRLRERGVEVT